MNRFLELSELRFLCQPFSLFFFSIPKKINHLKHLNMKKNMGTLGKTIRIVVAAIIVALYFTKAL